MQFVLKIPIKSRPQRIRFCKRLCWSLILNKSAPLHDGKIQIFWRGRVPRHQICSFFMSRTMLPMCTKKHLVWSNLQKCIVQLARPSAFATKAPCPWMTNCQQIEMSMPTNLPNSQCQYRVFRYWQGLSLLSPLWAQAPSTRMAKNTKQPCHF